MSITEYESEPIHGLPGALPAGEKLLWQGTPHWKSFAKHVFHVRKIFFYFALLISIQAIYGVLTQQSYLLVLNGIAWMSLLAAVTICILLLLARLYSRSTVYTVTSSRLVIRFGVAFPMIVNFPWQKVNQADLKLHSDGSGDIPLSLKTSERVSYLLLWPNVRPLHFTKVQPMMRNVPNGQHVAKIIASAVNVETKLQDTFEESYSHRAFQKDEALESDPGELLGT